MEAAAFDCLLFVRDYGRDGRLVIRLRLGHRRSREMAMGLIQNGFGCRATDHYPESKIYFKLE
jgi:hypothetical protein